MRYLATRPCVPKTDLSLSSSDASHSAHCGVLPSPVTPRLPLAPLLKSPRVPRARQSVSRIPEPCGPRTLLFPASASVASAETAAALSLVCPVSSAWGGRGCLLTASDGSQPRSGLQRRVLACIQADCAWAMPSRDCLLGMRDAPLCRSPKAPIRLQSRVCWCSARGGHEPGRRSACSSSRPGLPARGSLGCQSSASASSRKCGRDTEVHAGFVQVD